MIFTLWGGLALTILWQPKSKLNSLILLVKHQYSCNISASNPLCGPRRQEQSALPEMKLKLQ